MPAGATVVVITAVDLPGCDVLFIPSVPLADELGDPEEGFPEGEWISHSVLTVTTTVCDTPDIDPVNGVIDNPLIGNKRVEIANLNSFDIPDLFYVARGATGQIPAATFGNYDGRVNGELAMKIDSIGVNRPLIYESITVDGIFQAGETWRFVVQDYVSATGAGSFYTAGIVGNGDASPSIIVPEPAGIALSLMGGLLLLRRRR